MLAILGMAVGIGVIATVPPSDNSYYPRCQLHTLTGWHCAGCGATRAAHAAMNGRFAQAAAYNPLAFLIVPYLGWAFIASLRVYRRGRSVHINRNRLAWMPWLIFAVLILFTILRNIPIYPLTLLAPHEL